jgi:hypothetical protein
VESSPDCCAHPTAIVHCILSVETSYGRERGERERGRGEGRGGEERGEDKKVLLIAVCILLLLYTVCSLWKHCMERKRKRGREGEREEREEGRERKREEEKERNKGEGGGEGTKRKGIRDS